MIIQCRREKDVTKMAIAAGLANIEKLTETNYELWKVQMRSILVFNDLWQYVDGTEIKPTASV